jgi:hypothetical protein
MRPYTNSLDGVTAAFPEEIYTAREWLNRATDYEARSETGNVPANGLVELELGILKQMGFTVTDNSAGIDLVSVPFDQLPEAGEVAIKFDHGLLKLNSSLGPSEDFPDGHELVVSYTPLGSVLTAGFMNALQKELIAVEEAVRDGVGASSFTIFGNPDENTDVRIGVLWFPAGPAVRKIKHLTLFGDTGPLTGNTTLHVTTEETATGGVDITLPNSGETDFVAIDVDLEFPNTDPARLNLFLTEKGGHVNLRLEAFS